MRILVTRPAPDNERTAQKLRDMGHEPISVPLFEMQVTDTPLPVAGGGAALALTSANTVRALEQRLDLPGLLDLPVFTVGERSAEVARRAGFTSVRSANGALADLAGLIARKHAGGPVLYPAARHRSGDLVADLAGSGLEVVPIEIYEMQPTSVTPQVLFDPMPDMALFYSARTADRFARLDQHREFTGECVCLSGRVAGVLQKAGYRSVRAAAAPDEVALMVLVERVAGGKGGSARYVEI